MAEEQLELPQGTLDLLVLKEDRYAQQPPL